MVSFYSMTEICKQTNRLTMRFFHVVVGRSGVNSAMPGLLDHGQFSMSPSGMPFVDAAKVAVQKLPNNDPLRIVLEYLLKHGIGSHNAKPWSKIEEELDDHGIKMTQTEFQQTVLKDTRAGEIFIGSNDHGRTRGYFLIRERVDAITMRDFYRKRIAAEQANLANLERLIESEWPST